jgi:alpha-1,6-mannosyltransferase
VLIIPGEQTRCSGDERSRVYEIESPLVSRTSRYRALIGLGQVEEILELEQPALIESGDPYQVAWKAVASGRALGIPAVGFYHSHFPEAYLRSVTKYFGRIGVEIAEDVAERYVRTLYNRFERTLVPSPELANLLRGWGVDNVTTTDLGVDIETFRPEGLRVVRRDLDVPEDRVLLLYVGRLAPEKNVRTLFGAFEELARTEPGRFHLLVVGDGTGRREVERLRERTGAVRWMPYCGDAVELARIYRTADLFVHPGILETFGLVTLESQACGTPVVGIGGSYMDRIVFNDRVRWAKENTPSALAGAIRAAAATDLLAEGLAASVVVRERYSWRTVFDRLFSIYRDVIESYNP